jgi:hypothetical protein
MAVRRMRDICKRIPFSCMPLRTDRTRSADFQASWLVGYDDILSKDVPCEGLNANNISAQLDGTLMVGYLQPHVLQSDT